MVSNGHSCGSGEKCKGHRMSTINNLSVLSSEKRLHSLSKEYEMLKQTLNKLDELRLEALARMTQVAAEMQAIIR